MKPGESSSQAPENDEEQRRIEDLAIEVLGDCRSTLMLRFRFLDLALWRMPLAAEPGLTPLATDGKTLAFEPTLMLLRYRFTPEEAIRDLLHTMLHCIFRHPFDDSREIPEAWQLACDICVESIAIEMSEDRFASELDDLRKCAISLLRDNLGTLAPPKLYRIFEQIMDGGIAIPLDTGGTMQGSPSATAPKLFDLDQMRPAPSYEYTFEALMEQAIAGIGETGFLTLSDLFVLKELFERDSHHKWACMRQQNGFGGEHPKESQDADAEQSQAPTGDPGSGEGSGKPGDKQEELDEDLEGDVPENGQDGAPRVEILEEELDAEAIEIREPHLSDEELEEAEEEWEEVARMIEMELAANSMEWGEETGSLRQLLPISNRPKCDYEDFLRKFSVLSEDIKVNEDEFDYIFYTYGLQQYGNRPLIEPLEYQECDRVREFVIAIDTSGSCAGDLVRQFVDRTFQILKEAETFSSKVNIHIIQCDSRIKSDTKIESKQELDRYLNGFECRGFGGTDFRPVFNYVDELIEAGEFEDLRGLIYFTDGLGVYPSRMPAYETAFVFMSDTMSTQSVPPWAMKVILDEDEVRML